MRLLSLQVQPVYKPKRLHKNLSDWMTPAVMAPWLDIWPCLTKRTSQGGLLPAGQWRTSALKYFHIPSHTGTALNIPLESSQLVTSGGLIDCQANITTLSIKNKN